MRFEVYQCVLTAAANASVIIDCGANIGLASLYFARKFPHARILAVEPNELNFEELQRNVRLSGLGARVTPLLGGAWVRRASLATSSPDYDEHYSAFRVVESGAEAATVPGFEMSDLIRMTGAAAVDLLKMDIEGAEAQIFARSQDVSWLKSVRVLAVEFHGDAREATDFDRRVRALGFEVTSESDSHTVVAAQARPFAGIGKISGGAGPVSCSHR